LNWAPLAGNSKPHDRCRNHSPSCQSCPPRRDAMTHAGPWDRRGVWQHLQRCSNVNIFLFFRYLIQFGKHLFPKTGYIFRIFA
jgi:hypothetical protein